MHLGTWIILRTACGGTQLPVAFTVWFTYACVRAKVSAPALQGQPWASFSRPPAAQPVYGGPGSKYSTCYFMFKAA